MRWSWRGAAAKSWSTSEIEPPSHPSPRPPAAVRRAQFFTRPGVRARSYERVEVGQDSKDLFSSSFTACVHAVAINQTDMYDAVAFSICVHACNLNRASTFQVHRQLLGDLGPNVDSSDVHFHGVRR